MRPTLSPVKYKWKRARNSRGEIFYYINISESVMIHVWKDKRKWNWVIAGFPIIGSRAAIFRHGTSETLKGTERQIEEILPKDPEQMVWMIV